MELVANSRQGIKTHDRHWSTRSGGFDLLALVVRDGLGLAVACACQDHVALIQGSVLNQEVSYDAAALLDFGF